MKPCPEKPAAALPGMQKQTGRTWLDLSLALVLAATLLSLPGGAAGIHCAAGMLLLVGCGIHIAQHGRWVRAVILERSSSSLPALQRQRRLFWAMLLSGLLCGSSGLIALFSGTIILPVLCLVMPLHGLSGLAFLGLVVTHLVRNRNWFAARAGGVFRVAGR